MAKIVLKNKIKSRHQLANPFSGDNRHERMIKNGTVDLRENLITEDFGNGYVRLLPIDKNKRLK
ncbi:hypothetical protein ACDZ28_07690 [Paenibacillus sp. RS8]|uniref:hypothetical protein n=1 Tax=Paenibacillus sp. RS8 TaxID=3242681 RepID=UPI0035BEC1F8